MENVPGRQLPLSLKSLCLHGTALFWTLVSGPKALCGVGNSTQGHGAGLGSYAEGLCLELTSS